MKRINLSIDLEDNELLEESAAQAVRDYTSQVAREEFDKHLRAEIQRLIDAKLDDMCHGHYGFPSQVQEAAAKTMKELVRDPEFATTALKEAFDERCDQLLHTVEQKMENLDEDVSSRIDAKLNQNMDDLIRDSLSRIIRQSVIK